MINADLTTIKENVRIHFSRWALKFHKLRGVEVLLLNMPKQWAWGGCSRLCCNGGGVMMHYLCVTIPSTIRSQVESYHLQLGRVLRKSIRCLSLSLLSKQLLRKML